MLAAVVANVFRKRVLIDRQRNASNVDLLNDLLAGPIQTQSAPAIGTGVERMLMKRGHLLGRKRLTLMLRMSGLAPNRTLLSVRQRRLRLHNVRRRRLRRR